MMESMEFYNTLLNNKFDTFFGVPDSCLTKFTKCIPDNQINILPNEGLALSAAFGYYIARKKIPVVFLQNSGIGNLIDPLQSLTSKYVYNIPFLFVIGYRGFDKNDAPQHLLCGETTESMLSANNVKILYLADFELNMQLLFDEVNKCLESKENIAILIKQNYFNDSNEKDIVRNNMGLGCRSILNSIYNILSDKSYLYISSTGIISRELNSIIKNKSSIFCNVGALGHTFIIGLYISKYQMLNTKVPIIIEGDGSFFTHLGGLSMIDDKSKGFAHIVINNKCHLTVGGEKSPATINKIDEICQSFKYDCISKVNNIEELEDKLIQVNSNNKLKYFIEVSAIDVIDTPKPPRLLENLDEVVDMLKLGKE